MATKQELERILNDINHLDQIFHTKANTSHLYNLRSKPDLAGTPESGTQRHTNSFLGRLLLLLLAVVVILLNSNLLYMYSPLNYVNPLYMLHG